MQKVTGYQPATDFSKASIKSANIVQFYRQFLLLYFQIFRPTLMASINVFSKQKLTKNVHNCIVIVH